MCFWVIIQTIKYKNNLPHTQYEVYNNISSDLQRFTAVCIVKITNAMKQQTFIFSLSTAEPSNSFQIINY